LLENWRQSQSNGLCLLNLEEEGCPACKGHVSSSFVEVSTQTRRVRRHSTKKAALGLLVFSLLVVPILVQELVDCLNLRGLLELVQLLLHEAALSALLPKDRSFPRLSSWVRPLLSDVLYHLLIPLDARLEGVLL